MTSTAAHPRVLISYSHDSPDHKRRVLDLSNRLVEEGVDCHVDQYVPFPPQGWPRWTMDELEQADFVLVVCTETYHRRALGREEAEQGRGATWEGLVVTQQLYNAGGNNTKFVPVVFSPEDARYIPIFLQGYSRYNVATKEGYDDLYSLLTNQPLVVRPALGPRRELAPLAAPRAERAPELPGAPPAAAAPEEHDRRILVLIQSGNSDETYFVRAERIEEEEKESVLVLAPGSGRESAALQALRGPFSPAVIIAHDLTAYRASIQSSVRSQQGGAELWTLRVQREDSTRHGYGLEVNFGGISPAEQADMRARRILLNERPQGRTGKERLQDTMLEHYVAGEQYGVRVACSPFPELFRNLGQNPAMFLEAAKLSAVVLLHLSNVVQHIFRLDLTLTGSDQLSVVFEGQRRQEFSNVPAKLVQIQGICSLSTEFC